MIKLKFYDVAQVFLWEAESAGEDIKPEIAELVLKRGERTNFCLAETENPKGFALYRIINTPEAWGVEYVDLWDYSEDE